MNHSLGIGSFSCALSGKYWVLPESCRNLAIRKVMHLTGRGILVEPFYLYDLRESIDNYDIMVMNSYITRYYVIKIKL